MPATVFMVWRHNTSHPDDWPFWDATFHTVHTTRAGAEAWIAARPPDGYDHPYVILEEPLRFQ
jgi:hypothetical protein